MLLDVLTTKHDVNDVNRKIGLSPPCIFEHLTIILGNLLNTADVAWDLMMSMFVQYLVYSSIVKSGENKVKRACIDITLAGNSIISKLYYEFTSFHQFGLRSCEMNESGYSIK